MKCPKCGYNSFEYLDNCKKCSADLISFKLAHGINPYILPSLQDAASGPGNGAPVDPINEPEEKNDGSDVFKWGMPADALPSFGPLEAPPQAQPEPETEPFSFEMDVVSEESEPANISPFKEFSFGNADESSMATVESDSAEGAEFAISAFPEGAEEEPFRELILDTGDPTPEPFAPAHAGNELFDEDPESISEPERAGCQEDSAGAWFEDSSAISFGDTDEPDDTAHLSQLEIETDRSAGEIPFEDTTMEGESVPPETGLDLEQFGFSKDEFEALFGERPEKSKSVDGKAINLS